MEPASGTEARLNLQIVWRNPQPQPTMRPMIEQLVVDACGALYAVHNTEGVKVFELIGRPAAQMLGGY